MTQEQFNLLMIIAGERVNREINAQRGTEDGDGKMVNLDEFIATCPKE